MALFFNDFSQYSAGDSPTSGMDDWDYVRKAGMDYEIIENQDFSNGIGFEVRDVTNDADYSLARWNAVSGTNLEGVMRYRFYESKYSHALGLRVNDDSYYLGDTRGFDLSPRIRMWDSNNLGSTLVSGNKSISTGTWYRMRFRINGDTLKNKIWEDGTTEPSSWDVSVTDTNISSGKVGLGGFSSSSRYAQFDWLGIATEGDTAPEAGDVIAKATATDIDVAVSNAAIGTDIFKVNITGVDTPVKEGDEMKVYIDVENKGKAEGEQVITLTIDD